MKILAKVSLVFILLLFCHSRPLELHQIIEKHIRARGGEENLKKIHTARIAGVFVWDGQEYDFKCYIKPPTLWRCDVGAFNFFWNGTDLWNLSNPTRASKYSKDGPFGEIARSAQIFADIEGPLINYKEKGHAVELVGEKIVDGIPHYELKINLQNGGVETWFINMETFFATMKSYEMDFGERYGNLAHQNVNIYFSDYKPVDGILFPYYNERVARISHFVFKTDFIEFNIPLDDKLFEIVAEPDN